MSLLFNTLSRFVTAFFPRSKHLLILWLQSLSTVTLEPKGIKFVTASTFQAAMKWWDWMPWSVFWMLSFKPAFSFSSFILINRLFSSSFSSVQSFSHFWFFVTPWTATCKAYSNSCPRSRWCRPIFSSSVIPSPPAFNLSKHQGLFQWVSSLHQVAKVLEFQPQHQSFQWTPRADLL